MQKIKVVLILNNPNALGGPTIAMRRISASFLSEKYDFFEIHITEKLGKIPRVSVIKRIARELKQINPDIVHVTGLQLHGFYGVLSARIAKIKNILIVVRGSSCDAINISMISKMIFRKIIEPITIRLAKITYTVCNEMANNPIVKKNVKRFGGVIHNPALDINLNIFDSEKIRKELGFDKDDILVAYTGRIVEDKGLSFALDAFEEITNSKIRFLIVGSGVDEQFYKDKYKDLIEKRSVIFLGKRSDVLAVLSATDIYLFPTLHENLSNALLEACVMGLAVIATNIGGNIEVIKNEVDGILISPRDKDAIINAINDLSNNNKKREIFGERIQEKMKKEFSSVTIYNKLDELYREVLVLDD